MNNKKKNDIYLIVFAILIGTVCLIATKLYQNSNIISNTQVVVTIDKNEYGRYNLDEDLELKIKTEYGYNTLIIKDNSAYISEANCRDHICISQKTISNFGETIVCLPHKLVVEIKGGENSEFDAVVN